MPSHPITLGPSCPGLFFGLLGTGIPSALFTIVSRCTKAPSHHPSLLPLPRCTSLILSPSILYIEMATQSPKRHYDFSVQIPARRPRAWERVPTASFAPRHRGRKVWKRYELRTNKQGATSRSDRSGDREENGNGGEEEEGVERPVKRLRSTRAVVTGGETEGADGTTGGVVGYVPTLRSQVPGTPRSMVFPKPGLNAEELESDMTMWCFLGKFAKRKSLKPDLFRKAVGKAPGSSRKARELSPTKSSPVKSVRVEIESFEDQRAESPSRTAFEISGECPSRLGFESEAREDVLQVQAGPSKEDVNEALGSLSAASAAETDDDNDCEDLKGDIQITCADMTPLDACMKQAVEIKVNIQDQSSTLGPSDDEAERDAVVSQSDHQVNDSPGQSPATQEEDISGKNAQGSDDMQSDSVGPSKDANNDANKDEAGVHESSRLEIIPLLQEDGYDGPSEHRQDLVVDGSDIDYTPQSTVRDALDISELDPAEVRQEQAAVLPDDGKIKTTATISGSPLKTNSPVAIVEFIDSVDGNNPATVQSSEPGEIDELSHAAATISNDSNTLLVESIPTPQPGDVVANLQKQSPKPVVKLPDSTSAPLQDVQVDAGQKPKAKDAPTELPPRTTRSGARFSDDTNLLKDFLNRAQARKLAKDSKIPAQGPPQASPRRTPRKVLAEVDSNSPSPQRPKDLATRPGTPPGKQRMDAFAFDDVDELTAEPTSCRRSNRTRLPTVSKAPPGAPSFIPVRRADGTDPVVLPKSIAQDLAVQTRANTRRNKGQSKPPSVALQTLTEETTEFAANRAHVRDKCKCVGWDEKLVYYYQGVPAVGEEEGKEEKRPQVRRLRGLGASNGTPAPKRTVDSGLPPSLPAPRRRGRAG